LLPPLSLSIPHLSAPVRGTATPCFEHTHCIAIHPISAMAYACCQPSALQFCVAEEMQGACHALGGEGGGMELFIAARDVNSLCVKL
jgi:hypothetical protein